MIGLRTKLILGFSSILVIVAGIGMMIMSQLTGLGNSIDVILRENYRSVIACQNMKEALERIDSGILFIMNGNPALGDSLIHTNLIAYDNALTIEKHNITLPGEQEMVDALIEDASIYFKTIRTASKTDLSPDMRTKLYYSSAFPLFKKTKDQAQKILILNQENMNHENNMARKEADTAKTRMLLVILFCGILAVSFSILTHNWVLRPIHKLIDSVGEVSAGNLELMLHSGSKDEIGQLADAFNNMTLTLRERRRTDTTTLQRTQQATRDVISALSTAIAITDRAGVVEIATVSAQKLFGLKVGSSVFETTQDWLPELFRKATIDGIIAEYPPDKGYLQVFSEFKEFFFLPMVIPIVSSNIPGNPTGAVIFFRDMTEIQEQQELKHSVISTVSHQLKTPLTSLRMSIHLLLDENIGLLNEKQLELLQAAKEETERLAGIVDDLLNIHRINHDQQLLEMKETDPESFVCKAVYPFISESRDKGIELKTEIPDGLPWIKVDTIRFTHVFSNLLTNALRYTPPGGNITVSAKAIDGKVRFMISDTGIGIASEYHQRIFEQFYRVPNSKNRDGAGLGLAIVKEIVQAHGGEVGVESELNKGSTFWFELPAITGNISRLTVKPGGCEL